MKHRENNILDWFKTDRLAILSTLFPAIISLWGMASNFFQNKEKLPFIYLMQFLFVVISLFFILSNRVKILKKLSDSEGLIKRYFQRECRLLEEDMRLSGSPVAVVRDTVKQFYSCWVLIWVLWVLFYGWGAIEAAIPSGQGIGAIDVFTKCRYHYAVMYLFDFASSAILFMLYLVLNNVTVGRHLREEAHPNDLRFGGIFLLIVSCALGTLFIHGFMISDKEVFYSYMQLVGVAFGFFSAFAFVLFLGKLNSFYLQIPMLLNLFVYVYAIIQILNPIFLISDIPDAGLAHPLLASLASSSDIVNTLNIVFQILTLLGKVSLALILYWIVYKYRFIYFVITKSLSLTETPEKIKVFWKYMGETDG